jgi:hypothetical protein
MLSVRVCKCGLMAIIALSLGGALACESAARREQPPASTGRPAVADDPTSQDQAAGMAADDAEALRLKGTTTQPAPRRPPRYLNRQPAVDPRSSRRR